MPSFFRHSLEEEFSEVRRSRQRAVSERGGYLGGPASLTL